MVRTLKRLLEREGFSVDTALNGREALDLLRGSPDLPTVILLDLVMPVMDGQQFRQEQVRDRKLARIPVIIMTGAVNIESQRVRMGARAALKKPLDVKMVIEVVKQFLG